jgi:hypothetical protein
VDGLWGEQAAAREAALDDLPVEGAPSPKTMRAVAEHLDANQEAVGQFVDVDVVLTVHGRQE